MRVLVGHGCRSSLSSNAGRGGGGHGSVLTSGAALGGCETARGDADVGLLLRTCQRVSAARDARNCSVVVRKPTPLLGQGISPCLGQGDTVPRVLEYSYEIDLLRMGP